MEIKKKDFDSNPILCVNKSLSTKKEANYVPENTSSKNDSWMS